MDGILSPMTLRFRLREVLEEHGVNQSEFAKLAGLSFATINRISTNATAQVSLATLDKIIVALDSLGIRADLADVIERTPEKGRKRSR